MASLPPRIAILDYGAGNLRSVAKALERSGLRPEICADPAAVRRCDGLVLPGVGAFADAVQSLRAKGLDDAVREAIQQGRPYLGLCLGLQVLFQESDEHGLCSGLALLPGRVERFGERDAQGRPLRVPHIGWNRVRFSGSHPMLRGLPKQDLFYFVHSYRVVLPSPEGPVGSLQQVGTTDYGGTFASAVAAGNAFAVQFHPEKSQRAGKRLLDAYAAWLASC